MNSLPSRERLAAIGTYEDFFELCKELSLLSEEEQFDFLFPLALASGADGAGSIASRLLVQLDPAPTRPFSQLMSEIAQSTLDASDTEVTFYLISHFGKSNLEAQYSAFIASADLTDAQRRRAGIIIYWSARATHQLIERFHSWPYEE